MTIVVGWNSGSEVYLCADSVMSSRRPLVNNQSSLGERHFDEDGWTAQEAVLKIYRYENAGLGISTGDARAAIELAENVEHLQAMGSEPEQSFRNAITSSSSPGLIPPHCLAFGYLKGNTPTLLAFNQNGTGELQEVPDFVSFGSVSMPSDVFVPFLQDVCAYESDPEVRLLSCMGALQQFSVRETWMERGVGGVYSGLVVTEGETKYQPDTLVIVQPFRIMPNTSNSYAITARVRNDFLFVESPMIGGWHGFGYARYGETQRVARERARRAYNAAQELERIIVDYAMIIATDVPKVIIVKMSRSTANSHLHLRNGPDGEAQMRYGVELAREVAAPVPSGQERRIVIKYLSSDR
jgi:hypothetical protein